MEEIIRSIFISILALILISPPLLSIIWTIIYGVKYHFKYKEGKTSFCPRCDQHMSFEIQSWIAKDDFYLELKCYKCELTYSEIPGSPCFKFGTYQDTVSDSFNQACRLYKLRAFI